MKWINRELREKFTEADMVEVVFSESAGGSLKQARHYGEGPFRRHAGAVFCPGGSKPDQKTPHEVQEKVRRQAQEEWDTAVPMGGALGEVFPLSLALSVGEISADIFGSERKKVFSALLAEFPPPLETAAKMLEQAKKNFNTVMERAKAGEELRIWCSSLPDDQCALRWLLSKLNQVESLGKLWLVELPPYKVCPDGVVIRYQSWGEVGPGEWASFLMLQKEIPVSLRRGMAHDWKTLQEENAPLRAVINGGLCSVGEDFYDPFILRELAAQPQEFHQAVFIGNFLGKYRFGISDGWIALRMETWMQKGLLEEMTEPGKDDRVIYRRYLRKTADL